jgi:hypothetical protein
MKQRILSPLFPGPVDTAYLDGDELLVQEGGRRELLLLPRVPVDRVASVLQEGGGRFFGEAVGVGLAIYPRIVASQRPR